MKRYETCIFCHDEFMSESDDGEWAQAEVAQALYDALVAMREEGVWIGSYWSPSDVAIDNARKAIAKADGE